ncbi:Hypothetical protein, putative [Bodo saltans]|uniref:Uncharacterized protein n=1 Tax=Bodo saltans TaxID=75058 RepID=A0A0S4JED2_BODSA|nr:Hypothetical protein, putative [Bodo saltans]|eukprot:CUG88477.1 Hypothetical protein, putative [Bodo saltans]
MRGARSTCQHLVNPVPLQTTTLVSCIRQYQQGHHSPPSSSSSSLRPVTGSQQWMREQLEKAVASGKMTNKAYAYFAESLATNKSTQRLADETFKAVAGQDVKSMTRFQQSMIVDRVTLVGSLETSKALQEMYSESEGIKKYTEDGTPTGENYWFEERTLLDHDVPPQLKDEVLGEMRKDRRPSSPAFGDADEAAKLLSSLEENDRANAAAGLPQEGKPPQKKPNFGGF